MISRGLRVRHWPPAPARVSASEHARTIERGMDALERSFLGSLPNATLRLILRDAYPVNLPAGTRIDFDQENKSNTCLVLDGLLSAYISSHGRQITVKYNRPCTIFGIMDLVGGAPAWSPEANGWDHADQPAESIATRGIVSLTDSVVLVLSADVLRSVALSDPQVAWKMAGEITRVLYGMVYELSANVFGNLRQRLAHHLLEVAAWDEQHGALVASIGQQELADMMGTVREVVARTMGEFRREGLVERVDSGVLIKDALALHEMVHESRT
jgi:CRP/FNR family transcriptional regulator, cyclic AMP receptor protein